MLRHPAGVEAELLCGHEQVDDRGVQLASGDLGGAVYVSEEPKTESAHAATVRSARASAVSRRSHPSRGAISVAILSRRAVSSDGVDSSCCTTGMNQSA